MSAAARSFILFFFKVNIHPPSFLSLALSLPLSRAIPECRVAHRRVVALLPKVGLAEKEEEEEEEKPC